MMSRFPKLINHSASACVASEELCLQKTQSSFGLNSPSEATVVEPIASQPIEIRSNALPNAPPNALQPKAAGYSNSVNGILALVDQVVCSVTTLATFVVLAHWCDNTCLGAYALAVSLITPLRVLQDRLIATPYMMVLRESNHRSAEKLGSAFSHQLVFTLLAVLIALVVGSILLLLRGWASITQAVLGLVFVAPCVLWRDLFRSISFSHLDTVSALKADSWVLLSQIIGLSIGVLTNHISVNYVLLVTGISSLVGCLVSYIIEARPTKFLYVDALSDWVTNWAIARWLVAARIFGSAGAIFVPWIVAVASGEASAGLLATCTNIVGVSFMFSRGLNNYFRPRALDAYQTGGGKALRSTLIRMAMILSSYMLLVSLAFAMIGGILMVLVYGERFHDTGPLVCLLSFVSLATSLSMVGDNGVIALRRPDLSLWAELSNGTVTIILALALVSPFGLYGVACAMLIGQIVGAGVLGCCVWSLTKHPKVDTRSVQAEQWSAEPL